MLYRQHNINNVIGGSNLIVYKTNKNAWSILKGQHAKKYYLDYEGQYFCFVFVTKIWKCPLQNVGHFSGRKMWTPILQFYVYFDGCCNLLEWYNISCTVNRVCPRVWIYIITQIQHQIPKLYRINFKPVAFKIVYALHVVVKQQFCITRSSGRWCHTASVISLSFA